MSTTTQARRPRIAQWAVLIPGAALTVSLALEFCCAKPRLILAAVPFLEKRGESGGQWTQEKLSKCDPEGIGPTIQAVRTRIYCVLLQVSGKLGPAAHQALLDSIDAETNPGTRAHLISALQRGFSDFTRLDRVLVDAANGNHSSLALAQIGAEVRHSFPEAPGFRPQARVSLEFRAWWRTSNPQKLLKKI